MIIIMILLLMMMMKINDDNENYDSYQEMEKIVYEIQRLDSN